MYSSVLFCNRPTYFSLLHQLEFSSFHNRVFKKIKEGSPDMIQGLRKLLQYNIVWQNTEAFSFVLSLVVCALVRYMLNATWDMVAFLSSLQGVL